MEDRVIGIFGSEDVVDALESADVAKKKQMKDLKTRVRRLESALDAILERATTPGQEISDLHGFVIGLADGMRRDGRW